MNYDTFEALAIKTLRLEGWSKGRAGDAQYLTKIDFRLRPHERVSGRAEPREAFRLVGLQKRQTKSQLDAD